MRILVILAIGILCVLGIIAVVIIGGGMYQSILFDEYMEDIENPPRPNLNTSPNLPSFDILP